MVSGRVETGADLGGKGRVLMCWEKWEVPIEKIGEGRIDGSMNVDDDMAYGERYNNDGMLTGNKTMRWQRGAR